jgi:hypothetical protein
MGDGLVSQQIYAPKEMPPCPWQPVAFKSAGNVSLASGKIIPTSGTRIIQPFESGVVSAIHVRDGQTVRAGDVLISLDSTITLTLQAYGWFLIFVIFDPHTICISIVIPVLTRSAPSASDRCR